MNEVQTPPANKDGRPSGLSVSTGYRLLCASKEHALKSPACPYCGGKLRFSVNGSEQQEDGSWVATDLDVNCDSEPSAGPDCALPTGSTLADALPKEIERCQRLLEDYAAIGPVGNFGAMMIRRDIASAHKAMIEGDVVAMIRAYEALKGAS